MIFIKTFKNTTGIKNGKNKKLNPIVTELFIWGRKLNISQTNEKFNKLIAFNHSSDIDFKGFMNLYKYIYIYIYISKPYCFLVTDATLVSDNPSRFRKNLLERI